MSDSQSFAVEKEVAPSPSSSSHLAPISAPSPPPPLPAVEATGGPSSSTLASLDHPLPPLPLEVKGHILGFCDASTLISTSLVSLAFLEFSSPLLYRDITIRGYEDLEKFIEGVDPSIRQPHLDAYFDLHQIKTFTFIAPEPDSEWEPSSSSRWSLLLLIEVFTLEIVSLGEPIPSDSFQYLLPLFDPTSFTLIGTSPSGLSKDSFVCVDLEDPNVQWTRLTSMVLRDACPSCPAYLPIVTQGPRIVEVTYDLTNCWPYHDLPLTRNFVINALDDLNGGTGEVKAVNALLAYPSLAKVVLRVQNKAQLRDVQSRVVEGWTNSVLRREEQKEWAKLIEFEEVDSGARRFLMLGE